MSKANISMIAAMGLNRVIGDSKGGLPWKKIPEDFQNFKKITTGHPMIMGRKTWEEFGGKPLPNRTSIVITTRTNYPMPEGHFVARSIKEAINIALKIDTSEIFIIGGGQIYKIGLEFSNKIYLTVINKNFLGSTLFPIFPKLKWQKTESRKSRDENYEYEFQIWDRIN